MTEASISQQGDIHQLTGQLDFSSVARLLTANGWLQGDQVQIDMSHVEQSNSAAWLFYWNG